MKNLQPEVKKEHAGNILFHGDPMDELKKRDLVSQVGNGLFVFKGILATILNKIEQHILRINEEVGAEHISVPSILSWENTEKSEYLNSFKNQAMALHCFNEAKTANTFSDNCEGIASPTVCYHYFSSLLNTQIKKNYLVTAISKCTRKEEGILDNFGRCTNFTMREAVIFGTEEYCNKKRQEILEKTLEFFDVILDLSYAVVTASDPFFGPEKEMKSKAQLFSESKYEIQAAIPFNNQSLSIASFNNHGKIFFKRFSISTKEPELSFSSCVGWGYERILYAILVQKGIDFTTPYYFNLLGGKNLNYDQ